VLGELGAELVGGKEEGLLDFAVNMEGVSCGGEVGDGPCARQYRVLFFNSDGGGAPMVAVIGSACVGNEAARTTALVN